MNKRSTLVKTWLQRMGRARMAGTAGAFLAVSLVAYEGGAQSYSLKGWGWEYYGRLGNGNSGSNIVATPTDVYTDTGYGGKFVTISAGAEFSVGIKENGSLWAWGRNNFRQLGRDEWTTSTVLTVPTLVDSGLNGKWWKVSAAHTHCIALKEDSSVWAWGRNTEFQLGDGGSVMSTTPKQIAPGSKCRDVVAWGMEAWSGFGYFYRNGSAAILNDGSLYMWGSNNNYTLGDNTTTASNQPKRIKDAGDNVMKGLMVSVGIQGHTLFIREDSTLWGWGWNSQGQVGNGATTDQRTPVQIGSAKWSYVSAGHVHALGIQVDGSLWAWGGGSNYRLGNGNTSSQTSPALIDDGSNGKWVKVSAGYDNAVAVREDGTVWTWGNNLYGTTGDGVSNTSTANRYQLPYRFVTLEGMSIAIHTGHVLASGLWYYECNKPVPVVSRLDKNAEIKWNKIGGAASYQIAIDKSAMPEPLGTPVVTTDTVYDSGNILSAFDTFYVHFRTDCGYGNFSDWDTISFVAPFQCREPRGLSVVQVGPDSVVLNWQRADSVQEYEVVIDQSATLTPPGVAFQTTDELFHSGAVLNYAQTYYAHVRTYCTNGDYSDWDTISFRTLPLCAFPGGLAVGNITANSAEVTWNAVSLAEHYEIAVDQAATKEPGSAPDQPAGTSYNTGAVLDEGVLYYVHFRTYCGNNNYSGWDTVSFRTLREAENLVGSYQDAAASVKVFPNPVSDRLYVTASLPLTASVFGMDGKLLRTVTEVNGGIDVSGLAPGVYILKLTDKKGIFVKNVRFTRSVQ